MPKALSIGFSTNPRKSSFGAPQRMFRSNHLNLLRVRAYSAYIAASTGDAAPVNVSELSMVKKLQKTASKKQTAVPLAGSVKESAQQIWLAGLGAFAKAQSESGKAFETLVKEGLAIQRKTQAVAEEKISEATSKMADMASGLSSKATGITSLATGQWDKLENIFELRVAKALKKLGVPSSKEVAELVERIEELNKSVQKLSKGAVAKPVTKTEKAAPKTSAKASVPSAAAKTPAKASNGAAKPATKRAAARKATPEAQATV